MDRAPAERAVFVSDACAGDEQLRQEVESLMSSDGRSGTFLDSPAYEAAAEMIVDDKSGFKKGRTIGPFEILSFISRGGMGEVYLAHDPRLSRKVALNADNFSGWSVGALFDAWRRQTYSVESLAC